MVDPKGQALGLQLPGLVLPTQGNWVQTGKGSEASVEKQETKKQGPGLRGRPGMADPAQHHVPGDLTRFCSYGDIMCNGAESRKVSPRGRSNSWVSTDLRAFLD